MLSLIALCAMLLSPRPFRVEASGRAGAQLVRRCLTHLLPVRPTYVGELDLTSQGAPWSVSFGEVESKGGIWGGGSASRRLVATFDIFLAFSLQGDKMLPFRLASSNVPHAESLQ